MPTRFSTMFSLTKFEHQMDNCVLIVYCCRILNLRHILLVRHRAFKEKKYKIKVLNMGFIRFSLYSSLIAQINWYPIDIVENWHKPMNPVTVVNFYCLSWEQLVFVCMCAHEHLRQRETEFQVHITSVIFC